MNYDQLIGLIRKELFIIYREQFQSQQENRFLERMIAKHPAMRPELIIKDDKIQGFKKASKKAASLEDFPIYIEIEGEKEEDGDLIENIEIYSETEVPSQDRLSDLIYFTKQFDETISLDRMVCVNNLGSESLVVYSKVSDTFDNLISEIQFNEENIISIDSQKIEEEISYYLSNFALFIKVLDALLVKDLSINKIEQLIK